MVADASGATWVEHELVSWDTGETGAVVRELRHALDACSLEQVENGPAQWLDLATGVLTPYAGDAALAAWWGHQVSPDGSMVIAPRDGKGRFPRAGAEMVVERVSDGSPIAELPENGPAGWCEIVTWWTADSILAVCFDSDPFLADGPRIDVTARPRPVVLTFDEPGSGAGTVLRQIDADDPFPYGLSGTYVADGVVAWEGADIESYERRTGVYLQTGERIERLPVDGDGRA